MIHTILRHIPPNPALRISPLYSQHRTSQEPRPKSEHSRVKTRSRQSPLSQIGLVTTELTLTSSIIYHLPSTYVLYRSQD